MVYKIADNVLSPLGATTTENFQALLAGRSALARHDSYSGRKEDDYVASAFDDEQRKTLMVGGLTWFESLVYRSAEEALSGCTVDVGSPRTLFVVSTTKANIGHLSSDGYRRLMPAEAAQSVASLLGITTRPVVVCNACISGVAAIITAMRLLDSGCYDTAIITGCDVLSHFVVSGFQALKAMSPEPCRPFDIERKGLNLGEAAATMVLTSHLSPLTSHLSPLTWAVANGAIRNDAYHISSPSPKGEGCASAIGYATKGIDLQSLAAVNLHGTATMYNDQMESKAIAASGLSDVPANSLKGYFGHTLGASGILETIITMHSIENGVLLPTCGFSEAGVSGRVNISGRQVAVAPSPFVKVISGFGGCNAAVCFTIHNSQFTIHNSQFTIQNSQFRIHNSEFTIHNSQFTIQNSQFRIHNSEFTIHNSEFKPQTSKLEYVVEHRVQITPQGIVVDGVAAEGIGAHGGRLMTEAYKRYVGNYPRFYKMDRLCQLGFVASELLLQQERGQEPAFSGQRSDRAVVLFNHSSSIWADHEYEHTIADKADYFPSPSLFVYTLPNIVCGEIALRNGYHAETSFYILGSKDERMMHDILYATFADHTLKSILAGWIDYQDDNTFEADFKIIIHNS